MTLIVLLFRAHEVQYNFPNSFSNVYTIFGFIWQKKTIITNRCNSVGLALRILSSGYMPNKDYFHVIRPFLWKNRCDRVTVCKNLILGHSHLNELRSRI